MKIRLFLAIVVAWYTFQLSILWDIGITNATMYHWTAPQWGHVVGIMMVGLVYITTPIVFATLTWLLGYGIIWVTLFTSVKVLPEVPRK